MTRCDDCGDWVKTITIMRVPFDTTGRLCDWWVCAHCHSERERAAKARAAIANMPERISPNEYTIRDDD